MRVTHELGPRAFAWAMVSVHPHHGAWWHSYRDGSQPVHRKVAATFPDAEQLAAQINALLTTGLPRNIFPVTFHPSTALARQEGSA